MPSRRRKGSKEQDIGIYLDWKLCFPFCFVFHTAITRFIRIAEEPGAKESVSPRAPEVEVREFFIFKNMKEQKVQKLSINLYVYFQLPILFNNQMPLSKMGSWKPQLLHSGTEM